MSNKQKQPVFLEPAKKVKRFVYSVTIDITGEDEAEVKKAIDDNVGQFVDSLNKAQIVTELTRVSYHIENLTFGKVGQNIPGTDSLNLYKCSFLLFKVTEENE